MPWLFLYSRSSAQSNASKRDDSGWINLVDAPSCGGSTELEEVYAMLPRSGGKNHYRLKIRYYACAAWKRVSGAATRCNRKLLVNPRRCACVMVVSKWRCEAV